MDTRKKNISKMGKIARITTILLVFLISNLLAAKTNIIIIENPRMLFEQNRASSLKNIVEEWFDFAPKTTNYIVIGSASSPVILRHLENANINKFLTESVRLLNLHSRDKNVVSVLPSLKKFLSDIDGTVTLKYFGMGQLFQSQTPLPKLTKKVNIIESNQFSAVSKISWLDIYGWVGILFLLLLAFSLVYWSCKIKRNRQEIAERLEIEKLENESSKKSCFENKFHVVNLNSLALIFFMILSFQKIDANDKVIIRAYDVSKSVLNNKAYYNSIIEGAINSILEQSIFISYGDSTRVYNHKELKSLFLKDSLASIITYDNSTYIVDCIMKIKAMADSLKREGTRSIVHLNGDFDFDADTSNASLLYIPSSKNKIKVDTSERVENSILFIPNLFGLSPLEMILILSVIIFFTLLFIISFKLKKERQARNMEKISKFVLYVGKRLLKVVDLSQLNNTVMGDEILAVGSEKFIDGITLKRDEDKLFLKINLIKPILEELS